MSKQMTFLHLTDVPPRRSQVLTPKGPGYVEDAIYPRKKEKLRHEFENPYSYHSYYHNDYVGDFYYNDGKFPLSEPVVQVKYKSHSWAWFFLNELQYG